MLELFTNSPLIAGGLILALGLCIGSFLNVVIYRLPVMMQRQWDNECCSLNQQPLKHSDKFNLATPASRCPKCGHKIRIWENIPVISWLFLKAKCSNCHSPISIRYPLVELATGLLSVLVFIAFGPTAKMVSALVLTWALIALRFVQVQC